MLLSRFNTQILRILMLLPFLSGMILIAHSQTFKQRLDPQRISPGSDVDLTNDEGYLITGFFILGAIGNPGGVNLTKLSRNASVQWSKDYTYEIPIVSGASDYWPAQNGYLLSSFIQTPNYNKQVSLLDLDGNIIWSKRYGDAGDINTVNLNSGVSKARALDDNSFILAGGTGFIANGDNANDLFISRIDATGNLIWSKKICFSCIGEYDAILKNVITTNDGGILLCGGLQKNSFPTANNLLLVRLNSAGDLLWSRLYDQGIYPEIANDVIELPNGNFIASGTVDDFTTNSTGLLLEVNADGLPLNTAKVEMLGPTHNIYIQKMVAAENGSLVLAISTSQDTLVTVATELNILAKLNLGGNVDWAYNYETEPVLGFGTIAADLEKGYDNGFTYLANTAPDGFSDYYPILIQTDEDGLTGCETTINIAVTPLPNLTSTLLAPELVSLTTAQDFGVSISNFSFSLSNPVLDLGPDTTFCQAAGFSLALNANVGGGFNYTWNTGATTASIVANTAGTYFVEATNPITCLTLRDTINILSGSQLNVQLLTDSSAICTSGTYSLTASVSPLASVDYLWSTGADTPTISVSQSGFYSVQIIDSLGCIASAGIDIDIPNLIVPMITAPAFVCGSGILDAGIGYENYLWSTGETASSIVVNQSGSYAVTLSNALGCTVSDTVFIEVAPNPTVRISGQDTFCEGDTLTLRGEESFETYLWNTGQALAIIEINTSGSYTLQVTDANGCVASDTLDVIARQSPEVSISGPPTVCPKAPIVLSASGNFISYQWNTGESTNRLSVSEAGIYSVSVTDINGCTATATQTVGVDIQCLPLFVPNVFSPNDDGINDRFKVNTNLSFDAFTLSVFDRWGELVFRTNNQDEGWDGSFRGKYLNPDVYVWLLELSLNGQRTRLSGDFTLLR